MVMGPAAVLAMAVMLPLAVTVLAEIALGAHGTPATVPMVLMGAVLVVTVAGGGY